MRTRRIVFAGLCLLAAVVLAMLGVWQIERRAWKLALIDRVGQRLAAAPSAMPTGAVGPDDAYRKIRVSGVFDHRAETLVQAVTERGPGFWVVTPLQTTAGAVLVNRGFVPPERRSPATRATGNVEGRVSVTGLLRISEPGGAFLRSNDPAAGRWYSRDVAAIAAARGLGRVTPFFIDADAAPNPGGLPLGGLTVVTFRNSHLSYALTWFALSAMSVAGAVIVWRRRR